MRYANRIFPVLNYTVTCGLSGSAIFLHIISQMARLSEKNYWTRSLCADFLLQLLPESLIILQRIMQDIFMNLNTLHVQYQLFLSYFHGTRIFSTDFREFLKDRISWKAVQWEQLLHADGRTDGRTDRHADSISFSNFANAPEKVWNQDNVFASEFYVLLTMHPGTTLGKWQTWSTITLYNTFIIIILYMFRANLCSSSGGQIVLIQHLVQYSL